MDLVLTQKILKNGERRNVKRGWPREPFSPQGAFQLAEQYAPYVYVRMSMGSEKAGLSTGLVSNAELDSWQPIERGEE